MSNEITAQRIELESVNDKLEEKVREQTSKLQNALDEKELLIHEIHHRVKNNLAMISSLILLKDSSLGEHVDLSDITHQIDAIKIVYQKLHQAEQVASINIKEYIHELLSTVFSFNRKQVEIENNINDISIRTRIAIPIGLIINEIATNSIKHGFIDEEVALFSVGLKEDNSNEQYILSISNSGKSFPIDVSLENPGTLGLQLISALVRQLEGSIELKREPYPVFTIRFPMEKI